MVPVEVLWEALQLQRGICGLVNLLKPDAEAEEAFLS